MWLNSFSCQIIGSMHEPTDSFWLHHRACSGSNHSLPLESMVTSASQSIPKKDARRRIAAMMRKKRNPSFMPPLSFIAIPPGIVNNILSWSHPSSLGMLLTLGNSIFNQYDKIMKKNNANIARHDFLCRLRYFSYKVKRENERGHLGFIWEPQRFVHHVHVADLEIEQGHPAEAGLWNAYNELSSCDGS